MKKAENGKIRYVPEGLNLLGQFVCRRQPYQVWWRNKWGGEIVGFAKTQMAAAEILKIEQERLEFLRKAREREGLDSGGA